MENFNLDSSLYTITELENLFHLNNPYTIESLNDKRNLLENKIKNIENITTVKRENILIFLNNIYNKLLNNLHNQNLIIKSDNKIYTKNSKLINSNNINEIINTDSKTIKKAINIDSIFRNDYYLTKSTNFSITLTDKINKAISMTITSLQIPLTNYAISSNLKNNSFIITLIDSSGNLQETSHTITIPDGNYTQLYNGNEISIESIINAQLKNVDNDLSNNIIFTVDKSSGKSVFALSTSANSNGIYGMSIDFSISDNLSLNYNFGWLLGFRAAKYRGPSIISEGICNISGPRYIFLAINDYQNSANNSFIASYNGSILAPNIIGRINIKNIRETNGSYKSARPIYDDDLGFEINSIREYFGPTDIQKLTFTLYDEYGRIIDFNSMDWSLVLVFNCLYD